MFHRAKNVAKISLRIFIIPSAPLTNSYFLFNITFFNLKLFVMQKLLFVFCICLLAMACNNQKKESEVNTETTAAKKSAVPLPMPVTYSSSFEMGNPAYAAMIVQGSWKDWQDNKMDNLKSWMADSITIITSGETTIKGVDSVAAVWKRFRDGYSAVTDSINAVMPVYSSDKKENWVLVWVTEYNTNTKGVKDTVNTMETWRINKDGKADMAFQYDSNQRKQ